MKAPRLILLPWLVLAAALCITWLVWDHERQATRKELHSQFDFSLREAVSRIEQRLSGYEQMLRGVQSLFATTKALDRDAFRAYVNSLQLDANFSGIQAIGVAEWVPAARRDAHVAALRQLGLRDYAIFPAGARDGYAPITQRALAAGSGLTELGFDPWSNPERRQAMTIARDSGMAAVSGKVRLQVDPETDARPSFIMYLPIYAQGQPRDSVAQRRAALLGWVYASVHMDEMMASLYGESPPGVALAIHDGVDLSQAMLLYRSAQMGEPRQPAVLAANEYLVVAGHTWTLSMRALDDFESRFGRDSAPLIAGAGAGLSLLLALLAWLLATGRARALRLAGEMTRELRESEQKFRAIANCTVNWEVWWGLDGKPRWINPSVKEYTGYTVEECMSMPDFAGTLFHPEDMARVAAEIRKGLQGESGSDLECRCVRKDGSLFWLSLSWVPIHDARGVFCGFRTSGRDITERKQSEEARAQLEARLRESQKMEALGTLAGGVAHDFNNVLATISGNVELARQDVGTGHAALESLEEIDKASRRAKDLVQQILAFGRRQPLERKPMSLALVVVESARLLRATLPANVSLRVDCAADTPAVLADASQIQQILLNLCSNALQAVQGQGRAGVSEIALSASARAEAEAETPAPAGAPPRRYACLMVRDNGSGMDEATLSHIFEPFFTTKPRGQGTGLGLSVVHGIVQAHEARIEVLSKPGQGSAFHIYFPALDTADAHAAASTSAPGAISVPASTPTFMPASISASVSSLHATAVPGQCKHVLYIDDEEAIILLMTRLLERQGYRVSGFTDPRAALAAVRADPARFDLAVTDYNMPGMSGLEVALALREIRADLPVVLASGFITEELRQKAPAAGVRELIYKPNSVDDLCAAVARFANAQALTGARPFAAQP